jgi:large subunit ribosomal protein L10
MRDYQTLLEGVEDAVVVSIRGIPANENNELRSGLAEKDISVTVVRNSLARKAFEGSKLGNLSPVFEGPSALAYGGETVIDVARELVKWAKQLEELELKGAVLDGELYAGEEGVKRLSKFPTREEALADAVTLILSPGRNLAGAAVGPGRKLLAVVDAIRTKLEDGEEITKVG